MHSTDKPWKCDKCNYAHAVKAGLTEHKKYAHAKESDMIVCHLCTHQTPNKNEMKQHIATVHQKIKRFTCDECARQFYHNNQLQKHIAGNFVSHCNLLLSFFRTQYFEIFHTAEFMAFPIITPSLENILV